MSKNTDALRRYGVAIQIDPQFATEHAGIFIGRLADEVDRLRETLESVRESMILASHAANQMSRLVGHTLDPENFLI